MKKRTLVIGDIHGGLRALIQVLERCNVSPNDKLIFLGDYVDGWSESAQVIDFLIKLKETHDCSFICGNHDAYCMDWLNYGIIHPKWLKHGGVETISSYIRYSDSQKEKHISFFYSMDNYLVDSENRLFIHAGFASDDGPEKEHFQSNSTWDRSLWEEALMTHGKSPQDEFYPARLSMFNEIYIGHTPTIRWRVKEPWQRANVWNVDTGAAFLGKLSVIDVQTKEFWQSEPVHELYSGEKGRNS